MWRSQTNVCTPGGRLVVGGNAVSYVARSGTSLGGGSRLRSAPPGVVLLFVPFPLPPPPLSLISGARHSPGLFARASVSFLLLFSVSKRAMEGTWSKLIFKASASVGVSRARRGRTTS